MLKNGDLFTIKSDKSALRRITTRGDIIDAEWSPDLRTIAFTAEVGGNSDIFVMNAAGTGVRQITFGPNRDEGVTWSPNGKTLLFTSFAAYTADVYRVNVTPGSRPTRFTRASADGECSDYYQRADWHPHLAQVLLWYGCYDGGPGGGWWTAELRSAGTGALIKDLGMDVREMGWSPDGKHIAGTVPAYYADTYMDNVGRWSSVGKYLNDVTTASERFQTIFRAWSPDGRKIGYDRSGPRGDGIWTSNVNGTGASMFLSGYSMVDWR